jgi:hypothetical protein
MLLATVVPLLYECCQVGRRLLSGEAQILLVNPSQRSLIVLRGHFEQEDETSRILHHHPRYRPFRL